MMKAVVCRSGELTVNEIPAPRPGPGQVLLNVTRAGICGSDLHLRLYRDNLSPLFAAVGITDVPRHDEPIVFGHEICGEVAEYGPDTRRRWKPGTLVVAMPMRKDVDGPRFPGSSATATGAYADQIVVQESMTFPVPNGLSGEHAVLTEPSAVGWHAVRRSRIGKKQIAYVIGCGPVGLSVVAGLKAAGVRTIVASDFSPRRRELATLCGADVVVDPRTADPFASSPVKPKLATTKDYLDLGFKVMDKMQKVPRTPWWLAFRAMHALNVGPGAPVVFECVGVPGVIESIIQNAPMMSRVVVAGTCLEPDTFSPAMGTNKEIDLLFSTGYNPGEFRDTLHMIADGTITAAPIITGTVGLAGVDAAFSALSNPEAHAKILIDPSSAATAP